MAADGSGSITKIIPVWPRAPLPTEPFSVTGEQPPTLPTPYTGEEVFLAILDDVPMYGTVGDLLNNTSLTGMPVAPTRPIGDNSSALATTAFVEAAVGNVATVAVTSFNGRTGAVTLNSTDVHNAGGALTTDLGNYLPLTGGTLSGPGNLTTSGLLTSNSGYVIAAGTPGSYNGFAIQTNNLSRWTIYSDNTAELGANAGSNFQLSAYSDAGALLYTPITIQRSNGLVTLPTGVVISGGLSSTNTSLFSGNVAFSGASTTAPTRAPGDSTTNVATTAFVSNALAALPPGNAGTVTSVGFAATPNTVFGVVGSPITGSGTINLVLSGQPQNSVLAAPVGGGGIPNFRLLSAADIPLLGYLPLSGGAISGNLSVSGSLTAPTMPAADNSTNVATTAFVQAHVGSGGGGSTITISDTAPASPATGNLWFDSVGLQTYIWYTDPTSSQWVPVISQGGVLNDAPSDGNLYGRENGAWTVVTVPPAGIPEAPTDGQIYGRQGSNTSWQAVLPLTGGAITGPVTAPTPATADNSTNVATTAYARSTFVPLTGGTMTGQLTIGGTAGLRLNKAAGANNNLLIGAVSGSNRWQVILGDSVAESGSNAGSNFDINNYTDGGVLIGTALTINRANSNATFSGQILVNPPSTGANITLNSPTGNYSSIVLNRPVGQWAILQGQTAGSIRWSMALGSNEAETGSNAGSNFILDAYADNGTTWLGHYFSINRATGNALFASQLSCTAYFTINPVSGNNSNIYMNKYSGAGYANYMHSQTNGVERWLCGFGDGGNETGSNAGSNWILYRYNDGGAQIDAPLSINRATGVASFSQPIINGSDIRQKRDIAPISDALALVKQLAGVSYERISRPGKRELGLLAQDVIAIVPEAVEECLESITEDAPPRIGTDADPLLGVSYTQFTALLIEAVKQLSAEVDALKAAQGAPA